MTHRDRLLSRIPTLTAAELEGWLWAVSATGRAWHDGERAALMDRARQLGVRVAL